jgi:Putative Actinobacterial Holin-X, holin superfamily III
MARGGDDVDREAPIGELVSRLIEQGKGYARAEVNLVKAIATAKVNVFKLPAILLAAALLFVIAGVVTLCMTIALALATLIGPLAGGLLATVFAFAVAGGLAWFAMNRLSAKS